MKIILIAPIFPDLGISTIAPLLKKEGYQVNLLFIPQLLEDYSKPIPHTALENIKGFLNGADLVGINCLSENYYKTALLANEIKKTIKTPLIWGGIHATLKPQDCLKIADIVCVGEGEEAMLELVRKMEKGEDLQNIKNLLFRTNWSNNKQAQLRPPVDLDTLPPLDYDLKTQYILENKKIRNVEEADFKGEFFSYTSRSCPFRCSYCCNAVINNMYKGQKFWRQRSIDKVIDELKIIKRRFSSCRRIWFHDADFLSGKTQKDIEIFSQRYKAEIDVPFCAWSNPNAIDEDRVRLLKNAGFVGVAIGTISGSERIQRLIYKRSAPAELYLKKADILKKCGVRVEYDFILCNPYENEDEIISTIGFLLQLPMPFSININALTYFENTELYEMVRRDKIISEDQSGQGYTKATYKVWKFQGDNLYLNIVASLMKGQARRIGILGIDCYGILPGFILKFLIKRPVIRFFKHMPFKTFICQLIGDFIMLGFTIVRKLSSAKKAVFSIFGSRI